MSTILIVDDDMSFRETIEELLTLEGYNIISCGDGETASQYTQQQKPHLIIADMFMSGMTGLELLKLSKTDDNIRNIPFILLSGDTSEASLVEAQNNGAYSVVYKPFDVLKLLAVIEECLSTGVTIA